MELHLTNYKKFPKKTIPFVKKSLVIFGGISAGKTQLLWVYILFFRAYNLGIEKRDSLDLRRESQLLLNPIYHRRNFITKMSKDKIHGTARISGKIAIQNVEHEISFKLKTNGLLRLETSSNRSFDKIRFAHMGTSYQFAFERQISNIFTSFDQSLREKYTNLTKNSKDEINTNLRLLFPSFLDIFEVEYDGIYTIEKFEGENYDIINEEIINDGIEEDYIDEDFVDEESKETYEIEIMAQSASFQKVFASLILFLSLAETKDSQKYYLVDEPDTLMPLNNAISYVKRLILLSEKYSIKLIATTYNLEIANLFEENITL